jgi:hypothetical protein
MHVPEEHFGVLPEHVVPRTHFPAGHVSGVLPEHELDPILQSSHVFAAASQRPAPHVVTASQPVDVALQVSRASPVHR